ncbi:ParB/RepB/Spo0J family partition protein [Sphingobium yanoikuyae]|uniref:ParB/RepB/Spo0J family partition protein n=1 Tax=Sphingobium yanoikuyae TaxID=13690 RepID=A0AA42X2B5_SPHYA|nr:ParB N-terminal domain-containing protein [Sphingobium yanoikuyae]MDH2134786.1 ParB/RepB/Spo0J family partition protein [Sphingobium yanoikuyae]MDH2170325.1 ParB/RepB/Spo0J family partition protein [Sphingobium yanoikuyae]
MELKHIDLANLAVSATNMRGVKKVPDLSNILPSVRARGVLVPLIVRQNGSPETYEIIAGKRRYHAALIVAEENGGNADPLPCAVMAAGDDAAALEASIIENIARLDPDEVTRWENFTRLVKEGRSPEDISNTFGLTPLQVKRTLALGNLLPRIRTLYKGGQIDAATVRHLTLASKAQQRDWLKLLDDEDAYAPTGYRLKEWLFGGESIPTSVALFPLEAYTGPIVADLFGEDSYFASSEQFWEAQRATVELRAEAYRDEGWQDVAILEPGDYFHSWEHERCAKKKGGRVYIAIDSRGGVAFHEGYVTTKEARRVEQGEPIGRKVRPELSAPLDNYVTLHRYAAVSARLAEAPGVALRLMVAHTIAGSTLWSIDTQTRRGKSDAITESVENSLGESSIDIYRREALAMLELNEDEGSVAGGKYGGFSRDLGGLFLKLLTLDDEGVMTILAVVMAETLQAGTPIIELLGQYLEVDMTLSWEPDMALVDLLGDKEVLNAVLAEVAGDDVAKANVNATGKVQRSIIGDCLEGKRGREKRTGWAPRWMVFPPSSYTGRGGVAMVDQWEAAQALLTPEAEALSDAEAEPDAPEAITADREQEATDEVSPVAQEGDGEDGEPGQIAA